MGVLFWNLPGPFCLTVWTTLLSNFCNSKLDFLEATHCCTSTTTRVDMVGTNHDKVLTQWRHMPMCQFRANIFLIRITSNYFWASEVFKNQSFKSQIFSSSLKKNTPNWNHGLILLLLLFFIYKIQILYQFLEEKNLKKFRIEILPKFHNSLARWMGRWK